MSEYLSTESPNGSVEAVNFSEIEQEKIISLLEERLIIDHKKRKIGEVIVRKEIETRMIQVPVRREKLIIEQISPEHQQLVEIDLSQGEISGLELTTNTEIAPISIDSGLTVSGEFSSPKIASLLLNAIALEHEQTSQRVQVRILVENESQKQKYQEWFDRCSQDKKVKLDK
jgi:hypothetical protein